MADAAALRYEHVGAAYGRRRVLDDLSLSVEREQVVGILGPNGSGKTTLLRMACGWLAPASGRVTVDDVDVTTLEPRELARRVAVVPQDAGAIFSIPVLEAVLLARYPWHPAFAFASEDDVGVARAALREVEADHLVDRDLRTLSGGERQRVLLARALCQGGDLLLCDEPTAHLDMKHQAAVFRLLRTLRDRGRTVVVVTHDLNLASQACDRLALLGPDGLVAVGRPSDVVTPANLRAAYGIEAAVERDRGDVPFVLRRLT